MIIFALGITWVLDGLEVQLVGNVGPVLQEPSTLGFTSGEVGATASIHVIGEVVGALFFGYMTDRLGRKRLFMVTLGVYLVGSFLTAFTWSFWSFAVCRFIAGLGLGREYSAINSAIDELIPARVRGWTDLVINGTYWVGAAASIASVFLLDPNLFAPDLGWRLSFGIGAVIGIAVLLVRRGVPESPRWLMTHGKNEEAERVVGGIDEEVKQETGLRELSEPGGRSRFASAGPSGSGRS